MVCGSKLRSWLIPELMLILYAQLWWVAWGSPHLAWPHPWTPTHSRELLWPASSLSPLLWAFSSQARRRAFLFYVMSPHVPLVLGRPMLVRHNRHVDWARGIIIGWSLACHLSPLCSLFQYVCHIHGGSACQLVQCVIGLSKPQATALLICIRTPLGSNFCKIESFPTPL